MEVEQRGLYFWFGVLLWGLSGFFAPKISISTLQPTAQMDLNLQNDCTAYLIKLLLFSFVEKHSSNSILKSQEMIIKKGPVHL